MSRYYPSDKAVNHKASSPGGKHDALGVSCPLRGAPSVSRDEPDDLPPRTTRSNKCVEEGKEPSRSREGGYKGAQLPAGLAGSSRRTLLQVLEEGRGEDRANNRSSSSGCSTILVCWERAPPSSAEAAGRACSEQRHVEHAVVVARPRRSVSAAGAAAAAAVLLIPRTGKWW